MIDSEMIPNADQHLREYQALQLPKIVYGAGSHELLDIGTAKLTIGVGNTARKQREVNISVIFVPGLGRNLLLSSAAPTNGVETIIPAFPVLRAKGEHFPLRADQNLYCLDAISPKLRSEYANVGEASRVMLWHRCLGHINAQSDKELAEEKVTGIVVKDTDFFVSKCDTCTLAKSKQQNHPKVASIEVTQPPELVYTDLSGPISPASGSCNSYVATFTDHHTRLNSVYVLSKKNEAIAALINYIQDVEIPSGHRLQHLRSDRGGEYTGLKYREYCMQTGIRQELEQRIRRIKMAF